MIEDYYCKILLVNQTVHNIVTCGNMYYLPTVDDLIIITSCDTVGLWVVGRLGDGMKGNNVKEDIKSSIHRGVSVPFSRRNEIALLLVQF